MCYWFETGPICQYDGENGYSNTAFFLDIGCDLIAFKQIRYAFAHNNNISCPKLTLLFLLDWINFLIGLFILLPIFILMAIILGPLVLVCIAFVLVITIIAIILFIAFNIVTLCIPSAILCYMYFEKDVPND